MPTSYTLTMNVAAMTAIAEAQALQLVTGTTLRTFARANVLTPVDTGRLRAGNQWRVQRSTQQVSGEVWNDVSYAGPVHDGSRAHVVRPVTAKALRFKYKGKIVFAMTANIPARKGRPFLLRALREIAGAEGYNVTA